MNIPDPLLPLFDQGLVEEVVRPLMSGKEASVYLVRSRGILCVAKVYKEANNRTFRQRAEYAEGRQVRNTRQRRAMAKGSKYGKALQEEAWQNSEVQALYRLYEAGVRVPVPYHHAENVLLMELVKDAQGEPAPRLDDLDFDVEEALMMHELLIREVVNMLCAGLVHGDLSEYNILMDAEGPVIIDLPQTTDAAANQNSERLFLRDVSNLSRFLGRFAPSLLKTQYGPEIWDLYVKADLAPEVTLTGKFKSKKENVDANSVIDEIRAAEADAEEDRPMSAYQLKKLRKAEEAKTARIEEEKRAAAAKARGESPERTEQPEQPRQGRRGRRGRNNGEPQQEGRRQEPRQARGEQNQSAPGRGQRSRGDAQDQSARNSARAAPTNRGNGNRPERSTNRPAPRNEGRGAPQQENRWEPRAEPPRQAQAQARTGNRWEPRDQPAKREQPRTGNRWEPRDEAPRQEQARTGNRWEPRNEPKEGPGNRWEPKPATSGNQPRNESGSDQSDDRGGRGRRRGSRNDSGRSSQNSPQA